MFNVEREGSDMFSNDENNEEFEEYVLKDQDCDRYLNQDQAS